MSIGKNISYLRKEKGLTQAELGDLLGVSNQAVSKWESEMTMPDIMLLPEIAKVLGVTLEDIYCENNEFEIVEKNAVSKVTDRRIIFINVKSKEENANVKVRVPVTAAKTVMGKSIMRQYLGENGESQIDLFFEMIDSGSCGTLVDVDADECHVTITVEDYED